MTRKDDILIDELIVKVDALDKKVAVHTEDEMQKYEALLLATNNTAVAVERLTAKMDTMAGLLDAWTTAKGLGIFAKYLASFAIIGTIATWAIKKLGGL